MTRNNPSSVCRSMPKLQPMSGAAAKHHQCYIRENIRATRNHGVRPNMNSSLLDPFDFYFRRRRRSRRDVRILERQFIARVFTSEVSAPSLIHSRIHTRARVNACLCTPVSPTALLRVDTRRTHIYLPNHPSTHQCTLLRFSSGST